jgi:hypothetical protein
VRERWEGPGWSNGGASKCRAGIMAREERVVLVSSRQWVPSELTEDLVISVVVPAHEGSTVGVEHRAIEAMFSRIHCRHPASTVAQPNIGCSTANALAFAVIVVVAVTVRAVILIVEPRLTRAELLVRLLHNLREHHRSLLLGDAAAE